MSGTEIRRFSNDRSRLGGRWLVALLQAISSSLAIGLTAPIVILSAYIATQTTELYPIASISALAFGLWNLGALIAGRVCRDRLRQLPWAFGASAIRAASMAIIAYLVFHENPTSSSHLSLFLAALGLFGFASGFASAPVDDLLQKSFESSSRAQLFLGRSFWGVLAAILSGVVVHSVFEPGGPSIQHAFAYLFIAAAGCLASAAFFLLLIREPVRRLSTARHASQTTSLNILGHSALQRYLLVRVTFAAVGMLDVFIVVYAIRELTFEWVFLGFCIIAFCVALAICLPLSRALSARRGARAVLQTAAFVRLVTPLILLLIPYSKTTTEITSRISGDHVFLWLLVVCFAALGASQALQTTGNFHYLGEIAPSIESRSYFEITNIVLMFATLFPFFGAWVLLRWDYRYLFGIAGAIALAAVFLSGILVDHRIVASRAASSRSGSTPLLPDRHWQ